MNRFDKFADAVAKFVAHATFFGFCVALIVGWAPTLLVLDLNSSQMIVNTLTTIITFLLVALLQNTQERFERAQNERWAALFKRLGVDDPVDDDGQKED